MTKAEKNWLRKCTFCGGRGFHRSGHGDHGCGRCLVLIDKLEPQAQTDWFVGEWYDGKASG